MDVENTLCGEEKHPKCEERLEETYPRDTFVSKTN
jgi:hypothetical protein